ncbi:MAG: hypothetical protein ACRETU_05060 [Steroidobacterales bacterium]
MLVPKPHAGVDEGAQPCAIEPANEPQQQRRSPPRRKDSTGQAVTGPALRAGDRGEFTYRAATGV